MAETEGDKFWKAAKKLTSPSFLSLRMKSDWEQAGPLYEKAANCFKQAKSFDKAREAYEMAATCSRRQESHWHAGKHYERAAECAKETLDQTLAVDYLREAAGSYRQASRPQSAADCLTKGARWLEESNPEGQDICAARQAACQMLEEAIEEVEQDGKQAMALDLFRQAIGLYIRKEKHAEAVGMLLRFAAACDATQAQNSQCKAYLGAVVVWLFAGDGKQAWAVFQDALDVESFQRSDEAFAGEELFEAYKTGDEEAVKRCVAKNATFKDLDNQVARLAKKLPGSSASVSSISMALRGATNLVHKPSAAWRVTADDVDDDDLT